MKKIFAASGFYLLFLPALFSQSAEELYNLGIESYKNQEWKKAEDLFTRSILSDSHARSYFHRALSRERLQDERGYCEDLRTAAALGDMPAFHAFVNFCGTVDSLYQDSLGRTAKKGQHKQLCLRYRISGSPEQLDVIFDRHLEFKKIVWPLNQNNREPESQASFTGGSENIGNYLSSNLRQPESVKNGSAKGIVFLQFTVNERGLTQDIKLLKKVNVECDAEAVRLIKSMPAWIPARRNGHPVASVQNLPIAFN